MGLKNTYDKSVGKLQFSDLDWLEIPKLDSKGRKSVAKLLNLDREIIERIYEQVDPLDLDQLTEKLSGDQVSGGLIVDIYNFYIAVREVRRQFRGHDRLRIETVLEVGLAGCSRSPEWVLRNMTRQMESLASFQAMIANPQTTSRILREIFVCSRGQLYDHTNPRIAKNSHNQVERAILDNPKTPADVIITFLLRQPSPEEPLTQKALTHPHAQPAYIADLLTPDPLPAPNARSERDEEKAEVIRFWSMEIDLPFDQLRLLSQAGFNFLEALYMARDSMSL